MKYREINGNIINVPGFDKYGEVDHFEFDPDQKGDRVSMIDTSLRVHPGEPFPPFAMRSEKKITWDSEDLKGKHIVIYFAGFTRAPLFMEKQFKEFQEIIKNDTKSSETAVIVVSVENETVGNPVIEQSGFVFIPDGGNFTKKYQVKSFPTIIVIDKNGKLVRYVESHNQLTFKEIFTALQ